MWRQTVLPNEIVIADDGSDEKTKELITRLQRESSVPIQHIWHPDEGFRRTEILNKAIAKAKGDYILQVDGDVILARHFVSDHIELAQKNHFVCGSRVKLGEEITRRIFATGAFPPHLWEMPLGFMANSFRSRLLRRYMAKRYAREIDHLRGCNMAFWKEDVIKVNGYNEDLQQWGTRMASSLSVCTLQGSRKRLSKAGVACTTCIIPKSPRATKNATSKNLRR